MGRKTDEQRINELLNKKKSRFEDFFKELFGTDEDGGPKVYRLIIGVFVFCLMVALLATWIGHPPSARVEQTSSGAYDVYLDGETDWAHTGIKASSNNAFQATTTNGGIALLKIGDTSYKCTPQGLEISTMLISSSGYVDVKVSEGSPTKKFKVIIFSGAAK